MNIQTVAQNLRNTIAGKEQALAVYKENLDGSSNTNLVSTVTTRAAVQFLEINIDELKRILQDVEQCAAEQSWQDNPDRSGGQFTEEEIGFKPDGAW